MAELELKTKRVGVAHFKVLDEAEGIIEAIVNTFGITDYAGERTIFGCVAASLKRKLPKGVWMHDWKQPVAKSLEARELAPGDALLPPEIAQYGGMYVKGQFNLKTERGRDAFEDLRFGSVDEFSIGYYEIEKVKARDGVMDLREIDWVEWSPVLVGCNPATVLMDIKTAGAAAAPAAVADTGGKGETMAEEQVSGAATGAKAAGSSSPPAPLAEGDGSKGAGTGGGHAAGEKSGGGGEARGEKRGGGGGLHPEGTCTLRENAAASGDSEGTVGNVDEAAGAAKVRVFVDGKERSVTPKPEEAGAGTKAGLRMEIKSQYLGTHAEAYAVFDTIYNLFYELLYGPVWDACRDTDEIPEGMTAVEYLTAGFDEFRDICVKLFTALLGETGGVDEDMADEMEGDMKLLFPPVEKGAPPARVSMEKQLQTALAAVESCVKRAEEIQGIRTKDGRCLSVGRREQLAGLKSALEMLAAEPVARADPAEIKAAQLRHLARKSRIREMAIR